MATLIFTIILVIFAVIVLFIAVDYFARGVGGETRLWWMLKGLILVLALLFVLLRAGVLDPAG